MSDTVPKDVNADGVIHGDYSKELVPYCTYSVKLTVNKKRQYTAVSQPEKTDNSTLAGRYLKTFDGKIRVNESRNFGFVNDVFIPPRIVEVNGLVNGDVFAGRAGKTWDKKKSVWSWIVVSS